jgi:glycosyltransferase involved in cell wall biosynthesis
MIGEAAGPTFASKASVVSCIFDPVRLSNLCTALELVKRQTQPPSQIVVVVNGSEDLARLVRGALAGVTIVACPQVGVSYARELGLATATGEIVAFIDDDAIPSPNWLEQLVKPFAQEQVMMTSGWIIPKWVTSRPRWFPEEFLWVVGCSYEGLPESGAIIRNPIGASMAIRKSIIDEVGMFESRLGRNSADGNGCEETEYAIRAHQRFPEMVVIHAADSVVEHLVPAGRTELRYFFTRCWREGRSKAILVDIAGRDDSLSAERNYVRSTLPRGVAKGLRRVTTWGRSAAIIGGALTTAAGYAVTRLRISISGNA